MNFPHFSRRPAGRQGAGALWRPLLTLALAGPASLWAQTPIPPQDAQDTLSAAQASTPVPALLYRSVFTDLPKGVETDAQDWKAANAAVGQFRRGHLDLLKWERAQSGTPSPPKTEQPHANH